MSRLITRAMRLFGLVCCLPLLWASGVSAQSYPNKPVRIIAPYAAGGSTDSTARLIAQELSAKLGQQFVVENRPGAGGTIGHDLVAKVSLTVTRCSLAPPARSPSRHTPTPNLHTIRSRPSNPSNWWRRRR